MGGKGSGPRKGQTNSSAQALKEAANIKAENAEQNAVALAYTYELMMSPAMQSYDAQSIADRVAWYIDLCSRHGCKLQMNGLAVALGMTRQTLYDITHDKQASYQGHALDPDALALLRKVYDALAASWEFAIREGRTNPVGLIFLGKNHFGYVSEVTHTVDRKAPDQPTPALGAADRYASLAGRVIHDVPELAQG